MGDHRAGQVILPLWKRWQDRMRRRSDGTTTRGPPLVNGIARPSELLTLQNCGAGTVAYLRETLGLPLTDG